MEIEPGAEFVVELLHPGHTLDAEWGDLPKSFYESENGIILISSSVIDQPFKPRMVLLPPFPIRVGSETNSFEEIREFASAGRVTAIVLLRLGNYAVGVAENEQLAITKTGSRYVKGQHRKGGQSSNRFRRNREKWIRELFDEASEILKSRIDQYPGKIDHVVLGGDRVVLGQFLKRADLAQPLMDGLLPQRLAVAQPGRKSLDEAVRELWSYRVIEYPN